jgi:fructose-1,6-bisphosphatase/inositol monophosphatase family enzyme
MSCESVDLTPCRSWLLRAEEIARQAGDLTRKAVLEHRTFSLKQECTSDLVTETDQLVEHMIFESLKTSFPDHW